MNVEENRLLTFNEWPPDAEVNPQRIAKAGFFYTRNGLEVECFACHVKLSQWNYGDQVMARHKFLSPSCPFVVNPSTSGNVPITISNPRVTLNHISYEDSMALRLSSFENWPVSNIVTPENLARAGFYYLKEGDNTKCAFCKGVVRAWEAGDDPDMEHKRHFPNCPFVINVINLRLQARNAESEADNPSSQNTREKESYSNVNLLANEQNLDELGVQTHKGPKRSNYATIEARLRTFAGWSADLIQTPSLLAEAGFYYEGMSDQVRCFHCDGGLRHWDPHDDPWTEHAKWFPTCSFVKLVKGQDFVNACAAQPGTGTTTTTTTRQSPDKMQVRRRRRFVSEPELQEHLSSPAALAALSIGLNIERVKRAIRERIENCGRSYSQPDALVEAALNLQHDEEDYSQEQEYSLDNNVRESLGSLSRRVKHRLLQNGRREETVAIAGSHQETTTSQQSSLPPTPPPMPPPLEKSVSLEEENRILKEARLCKICMDGEVGIVFLPCGHLATCVNCAPNLEDCPVCRSAIKATVRTFLS